MKLTAVGCDNCGRKEKLAAKAETDTVVLVEACNHAICTLENLLRNRPGGVYFHKYAKDTEHSLELLRAAVNGVPPFEEAP